MTVELKTSAPTDRWETIELPSGDTFEVLVKLPLWEDILSDHADAVAGIVEGVPGASIPKENRLKTIIVSWRGVVNEEGEPVPFSFNALKALCVQTGAFNPLSYLVDRLYAGLGESAEKKSDAPSATRSEE